MQKTCSVHNIRGKGGGKRFLVPQGDLFFNSSRNPMWEKDKKKKKVTFTSKKGDGKRLGLEKKRPG